MPTVKSSALAIVAVLGMTGFASAQQPSTSNQQQDQGMQGMQGMQKGQAQHGDMDQMMQSCRKTMKPMMQKNTQAKKDIEAAKASNDPTKMRAALDEAENAIEGMNTHMNTCMSMMEMMQNMHGTKGSGMMGSGMMGGQQKQNDKPDTPPNQ